MTPIRPRKTTNLSPSHSDLKRLLDEICHRVLDEADHLNELDAICGDGECGSNLAQGARALMQIEELSLKEVALRLNSAGCGTLGTLFSFMILKASKADNFRSAILIAMETLDKRSGAKIGDKTMADAFLPWALTLIDGGGFSEAAREAHLGAERTTNLEGKRGRSIYAGHKALGTQDPGAYITSIILEQISEYCEREGIEI